MLHCVVHSPCFTKVILDSKPVTLDLLYVPFALVMSQLKCKWNQIDHSQVMNAERYIYFFSAKYLRYKWPVWNNKAVSAYKVISLSSRTESIKKLYMLTFITGCSCHI